MGCLIAFRLCRSRVLALAVALLAFFVSQGWASCINSLTYTSIGLLDRSCKYGTSCDFSTGVSCLDVLPQCNGGEGCPAVYKASSSRYWTGLTTQDLDSSPCGGSGCYSASPRKECYYSVRCDTQIEADSVSCIINGNKWNSLTSRCERDCKNRACCDSVAQNSPVKTDTTWEGCVSATSDDRCVVYDVGVTPGDTTVSATCNGKSRYRVCTEQYMWSESAKQCAPIMTNNCVTYDVADSNCTDVRCYATQQHALSSLDYDHLTQCYSGTETVQKILICDNGIREDGGYYTRPWKVCQPYLDSIGTNISDYVAGKSGYSGTGYSAGGGSSVGGGGSGGGGSDPNYGGCVGNGCGTEDGMAPGYQGGPGVDAQGNEVENSPSPGIGGQYTPTPQIVTEYDSTTGKIEIVKNSSGGDSIVVNNVFSKIRCLGVSNGVATLTNGLNTWSCEAQSCSQATLSASINQGQCSPLANGVTRSETNPSMPTINYGDDATSSVDVMFGNYEAIYGPIVSTLNSNHRDEMRHQDSISAARDHYWKVTFGDDLSYVESIKNSAESAAGSISNGFNNTILAVSNGTDNVVSAVQNASTSVSTAVGNAASDVSGSVSAGATKVANAVNSASSNVSTAVGNAATSVAGSVDNMKSTLRDTLHRGNQIADGIYTAVSDTGRNIPTVVKSIDSQLGDLPSRLDSVFTVDMESWSNDKLKIMMDSNTVKVVDALDNLNVDIQLDSIRVQVPHDTILDSIDARLQVRSSQSMEFVNDTLDLAKVYSQAFDEAKVDTNLALDSSVVIDMRSRYYVNGSDVADPTNVDSVSSVLNSKLDSSKAHYNARSDSMTRSLVDSTLKYSGIDSGGAALRRFFNVPDNGCPRQCLDITLQIPQNMGGGETQIKFSEIVCDKKIIGNYGVLDFVKLVLRILTAYLSLMFIWNAMWYLNTGAKKK